RALKLWLAFRAHGAPAFREAIERNLREAQLLYDTLATDPAFEVLGPGPQLSIVPFRHAPEAVANLDAHNDRLAKALLADGRVHSDDRLSWTSFVVLWVLWVWGELESRDLAAAVGISRPNGTGVVTTLEGRGFVRRRRGARDGRMVIVSLTDVGRLKIEELFP